jgi:hypothetical protein
LPTRLPRVLNGLAFSCRAGESIDTLVLTLRMPRTSESAASGAGQLHVVFGGSRSGAVVLS